MSLYLVVDNTEQSRNIDYTGNRRHAQMLVDKLLAYYHKRGFTDIKVWLEPEVRANNKRFWNVRSSIVFRVPQF